MKYADAHEKDTTKSIVTIYGIKCYAKKEKFPDGKWRITYRFTVPGWEECTVTGIRAAKRVIHGRLDPFARNVMGIE